MPTLDVKFWEKWYNGTEIERIQLINSLPSVSNTGVTATLLNSYLEDLADYLDDKYAQRILDDELESSEVS